MRIPRAYAPELTPDADQLELSPEESAHLRRVLRLNVGSRLRLFDGRGLERAAEITAVHRDRVELRITGTLEVIAEPSGQVTLGQCELKGDGFDSMVRDAVMLGVARIVPILSQHTQSTVTARRSKTLRWRRIAIASAKQCGRAVVPDVSEVATFEAFLSSVSQQPALRLMLAEPSLFPEVPASTCMSRTELLRLVPQDVIVMSGPEGGWAVREVKEATAAGFRLWSVGSRTYRAEAMALVALAVLSFVWESVDT